MGNENPITFKHFLEETPPGATKLIQNLQIIKNALSPHGANPLALPPIDIHCDTDTCSGTRIFRPEDECYAVPGGKDNVFAVYLCSNCRTSTKIFALSYDIDVETSFGITNRAGRCYKHGELPPFGPPAPKRLMRLFQSEREYVLKALRCENQGLGIAAFAYYRRIVENKKDALFDQIIKVSQTVGAPPSIIKGLETDKGNIQFSNSARTLTSAVPEVLLFGGENPLLLLHNTLSVGIHGRSDKDCLSDARDVRVLLVELVRLIDNALAEKKELHDAIKRLSQKKSAKLTEAGTSTKRSTGTQASQSGDHTCKGSSGEPT